MFQTSTRARFEMESECGDEHDSVPENRTTNRKSKHTFTYASFELIRTQSGIYSYISPFDSEASEFTWVSMVQLSI